jgi:MOSC domain-containing protein YiiM
LDESSVRIGDRFRIGNALVAVTQPWLPCYKLGLRLNDLEMPKRFHASARCGFYLAVQEEGDVGGGDRVTAVARNGPPRLTTLFPTAAKRPLRISTCDTTRFIGSIVWIRPLMRPMSVAIGGAVWRACA